MQRTQLKFPELVYGLAFMLYLFGSSLAHIENGAELSLWLMTFAVLITASTTLLPFLGIGWLRLPPGGYRAGRWLAFLLQLSTWGTFSYAMFQRLRRNLPEFQSWILLTTLLWAAWMLIFIYSRHAYLPHRRGDTRTETLTELRPDDQKEERNEKRL